MESSQGICALLLMVCCVKMEIGENTLVTRKAVKLTYGEIYCFSCLVFFTLNCYFSGYISAAAYGKSVNTAAALFCGFNFFFSRITAADIGEHGPVSILCCGNKCGENLCGIFRFSHIRFCYGGVCYADTVCLNCNWKN